jgi:hypothetical protein
VLKHTTRRTSSVGFDTVAIGLLAGGEDIGRLNLVVLVRVSKVTGTDRDRDRDRGQGQGQDCVINIDPTA